MRKSLKMAIRILCGCGMLACMLGSMIAALPASAKDNDPHMTGLRPPTVEEQAWMDDNMLKVKKVKLNKLGLGRINEHLKKHGKQSLEVETVEIGAELEGVVGAAANTGADASQLPAALPPYVDNSILKYFPPVRSQGGLNSCAQFSSVYYTLTHMTAMARNWDAKVGGDEYRFNPSFTYNMVNGGENVGSWPAWNIMQNNGCIRWSIWAYTGDFRTWCMNAEAWRDAVNYRADKTWSISGLSAANNDAVLGQVKTLLNNGYVMNYATYINSWQWKSVANDPSTTSDDGFVGGSVAYCVNGTAGGHEMTVVGYSDDIWCDVNGNGVVDAGEKGALRICNSWGTGWGQGGFAWVTYDALRTASIVPGAPARTDGIFWSGNVQGITARVSYTPKVLAKVTLNHAQRNQIGISDGVSKWVVTTNSYYTGRGKNRKLVTTVTTNMTDVAAPNSCLLSQGGAYAFDGGTVAIDGTFYFDVSDVAPAALTTATTYFSGATDSTAAGSLGMKAFSIIDVGANVSKACATVPATVNGTASRFTVDYTAGAGSLFIPSL